MLKHQNPEELADDEVKEGEILPPEEKLSPLHKGLSVKELFQYDTDLEQLVSEGHVRFARLDHLSRIGRMVAVVGLLGFTASIGAAPYLNALNPTEFISKHAPDWLTLSTANAVSDNTNADAPDERSRSWLGRLAWSVIGFDETKAVALPDGQRVHAKYAFLSQLPPPRAGQLNADGFHKLVDDYKTSIIRIPSADEQKLAEAKEMADRMEKSSAWNTEAWNLRLQIATVGKTITKPTEIPTVPAQGLWKSETSQQEMASDGVIATDGGRDFFAAAYIGGVPAVTYFPSPSSCYTIFGVSYEDCRPLADLSDSDMKHVRDTLYGETPAKVAAAKAEQKEVGEEDRWYLNFPLVSETSTLANADFDTLTKAVNDSARAQGGFSFHTTITSPISLLPAQAVAAPAKGLLKNPVALEAMKKGGVIGTTDIPGRVVLAAYVDGKAEIRIRAEDQRCTVLLGNVGNHCWTRDVTNDTDIQALAKSLFETPDETDQALKPYFWYSVAPMVADKSLDANDIVRVLNAALNDVANYGDDLERWSNTRKLEPEQRPVVARPEGFFLKPKNNAALSRSDFVDAEGNVSRNTGTVIIPKGTKDMFLTAVNFDGHLTLSAIEIEPNGRWNCWTIFGQVGQPIGKCRAHDLTKYADVVKSMFEPTAAATKPE